MASDEEVAAAAAVPALTIVSHPQLERAGERALLDGIGRGGGVALSRNAPDFAPPGTALGRALDDPFVSRRPVRLVAGPGGGVQLIAAAGGTSIVAALPFDGVELSCAQLADGVVLELAGRIAVLLHLVEPGAAGGGDDLGMLGASAEIARVRMAIEHLIDVEVPVLIRGETGVGKELVARAVHARSPRRDGPFVSVNLGALPRELAAAELFGAVKGAYTGATRDREGLFRAAAGGTLFLDELGEASPEVQVMLLRVLETGELYPVGSDRPIASHARLIAATDAPLERAIDDGQFKAPLLHRLAGFEIHVPPLRARRADLGVLFHHFARQELAAIGELDRLTPRDPYAKPWLPAAIASRLVRYAWPGNIRELRNLTRRLVLANRGEPQLQLDAELAARLPPALIAAASVPPGEGEASAPMAAEARRKPAEVSEAELVEALRACAWDLKAAADRLRIPRPSMYALIERFPHIRTAGSLRADEIAACFDACDGDLDAMVRALQVSRRALQRRINELGLIRARGPRTGGEDP
jgi:two-component system nitrogen regulation response regulator GlnG